MGRASTQATPATQATGATIPAAFAGTWNGTATMSAIGASNISLPNSITFTLVTGARTAHEVNQDCINTLTLSQVYALDAGTGQIRWRFAAGAPVLSEPLVASAGQHDYVVFSAGEQLLAVDAATGQLAWSGPGRGFSTGRAVCDGQRVYTAAADGYARAHDLATGREAWSHRMVSSDRHRVALYSGWDNVVVLGAGAVVVATVSGSQALEAADGHEQSSVRYTLAQCFSAPAIVGDILITGDQGGLVHGIRLPPVWPPQSTGGIPR